MTQHAASQTPGAVLLQEIFITHELERRPRRPPEYQAENRYLVELARELAHTPESILQRVTEVARELCHAETAGISLIEQYEGQAVFRWRALAGAFAAHLGNMTQRDFSPCGIVMARRQVQLFASPGRYYPYLEMQPPIVEILLLPFFVAGEAKGTLWVMAHDEQRKFDAEDVRVLSSLTEFTGAALQLQSARDTALTLNTQLQSTNAASREQMRERQQAEAALEERARLAAFGAEVSSALTQGETLRDMVQHCTEVIVGRLDAAFARIWTLNPAENVLELQASAGLYTHRDGPHGRVPMGQFKIGLIARERKPHLTNAVIGDPRVHDQEWAKREGMVAFAGYPLLLNERLVGVVALFARHALTDATLQALGSVANGIALGIERKRAEEAQTRLLTELQRINAELQQFAYIVSHDLKEPLRNIAQLVTFLAEDYQDQLDGQAQEYITRTVAAVQRLQQMLSDLLAYTQVGGRDFAFVPVDCEALLTTVLEDLEVTIVERNATLTHDPLPTVGGDATHLGQVFQNLIGNALKFCGKDPPRIHVSTQRDGNHWQFSVRDNGVGIDPTQAGRLFQVFQRLHTRSAYPGTGIGLAICKKIIEQHGGRIWVDSRPGEGSIFYFTISERKSRTAS